MQSYNILIFFLFVGGAISGGAILTGLLLGMKSKASLKKGQAYESGILPFGTARIQFKVGYYLFALLFLVFDIESLFLFPAVRVFRSTINGADPALSMAVILVDLVLFVTILLAGLAYAWKKGALKWE